MHRCTLPRRVSTVVTTATTPSTLTRTNRTATTTTTAAIIDPAVVQEARSFLQAIPCPCGHQRPEKQRRGGGGDDDHDYDDHDTPTVSLAMKESTHGALAARTTNTTDTHPRPRPMIAWLTLRNPRRRNALSPRMMLDMERAIAQLERECAGVELASQSSQSRSSSQSSSRSQSSRSSSSRLGALIVTGQGRSFCAGLDLSVARTELITPEAGRFMSVFMQQLLHRLHSLPLVSVAAIDGPAMGGGAELATACDLRMLTEHATVQFVQLKMGVTPGWGGLTRLVKLVGRQQALLLLGTMKPLDAKEALRVGFGDLVVPAPPEEETHDQHDRHDRHHHDHADTNRATDQATGKIVRHLDRERHANDHRALSFVHDYVSRHFLSDALQDVGVLRSMKGLLHEIADQETVSPADSYARERQVFASVWGGEANVRALTARKK